MIPHFRVVLCNDLEYGKVFIVVVTHYIIQYHSKE